MAKKTILGLDLGTNSIGWAVVETDFDKKEGKIIGNGTRIIPMDKGTLGNFEAGNSISQTAERTRYRGMRRLYQRHVLRRDRLHRVLDILGFLPPHYAESIDFDKNFGQFKKGHEVRLNYKTNLNGKAEFIFQKSFLEMVKEFKKKQPQLFYVKKNSTETKIPYDWTIYYLRKKAINEKIDKYELAWLLLNFNQKRGYYQFRGENEIKTEKGKSIERYDEKVDEILPKEDGQYEIILESGISYTEESNYPITKVGDLREVVIETKEEFNKETKQTDLVKTVKVEFITSLHVNKIIDTGEVDRNGFKSWKVHLDNGIQFVKKKGEKNSLTWEGKYKTILFSYNINENKRSISAPEDTNWTLNKKKTEQDIRQSNKSVGTYIYDMLLQNPSQKINGKLIKTIERKFYRDELKQILETQIQNHPELKNRDLYEACLNNLYPKNKAHKRNISNKTENEMFRYLFMDDIIFYQRPLKSKKSTIANCKYETRTYFKETEKGVNEKITEGLKVISRSNPLFIEFRLWQFIHNLRIYRVEEKTDIDITPRIFPNEESICDLFDFLKSKRDISQKEFIDYLVDQLKVDEGETHRFRWNYVEDRKYPINETYSQFIERLNKIEGLDSTTFLTQEKEKQLWHIVYSVKDKVEFEKALSSFANKNGLDKVNFVRAFKTHPPYSSVYGSYSEKAIKKLLPLMRRGRYWNVNDIPLEVMKRVEDIYERIAHLKVLEDTKIKENDLQKAINAVSDDTVPKQFIKSFLKHKLDNPLTGLNTYQACYAIYERHSEAEDIRQWKTPIDIDDFLEKFKQHQLRNPIVEKIVLETLRTVKDIWEHHLKLDPMFNFDEIHLELGRDMKNSADKRKRISDQQTINENTNNRIKLLLEELGAENARSYSPSHQEILKIYEEGIVQNPNVSYQNLKLEDVEKIRKKVSPTLSEIRKYKLWLEQGYISPYTGRLIPLSNLFSPQYEIEHIIPKSRYFDDSLTNKIICESDINRDKSSKTAYEYIKEKGGSIVEGIKLLTLDEYESHCSKYFKKNRHKLKNLLREDIPDSFINRQMNDSRYISTFVKEILGNIVRQEDEKEATPKNLIPVSGAITAKLKQDWGLNEQWNKIIQPRFERMNNLTNSQDYGYLDFQKDENGNNIGKQFFRLIAPKGINKKRIDHRHHSLDAIVIACCTKDLINYITSLETERKNYSLVRKLCNLKKIQRNGQQVEVHDSFIKPWENFTIDVFKKLETTIISFKKNTRVITKVNNKTWQWEKDKKGSWKRKLISQKKGDSRSIRKALHKETVYGSVKIKEEKDDLASIKSYLTTPELLVDKTIREKIKALNKLHKGDKRKMLKYLKDNPITYKGETVNKVKVWKWTENATASKIKLTEKFTRKQLLSITDSGIQKILSNHLKNFIDENRKEHFDLAFNPDGIEELNKNIKLLNNGKKHKPIYSVRVYEQGSRYAVSQQKDNPNKTKKFVEAAKGTNLFFAVYWNQIQQKRAFETIPFIEVVEHLKWRAMLSKQERNRTPMIPIKPEKGNYLFHLSPNDLVYVPNEDEIENPDSINFDKLSNEQVKRVYKMVSSTGNQVFFVQSCVATIIENKKEFSTLNKMEKSIDDTMIKYVCWKLETDRMGNIIKIQR